MSQKKTTTAPSKKGLLMIGLGLSFLIPIGLLTYRTIQKNKVETEQAETTRFTTDSKSIVETEKALQLLSTQVNKGLDSIKNNKDEK